MAKSTSFEDQDLECVKLNLGTFKLEVEVVVYMDTVTQATCFPISNE
jgi:hypothetical protein